MKNVLVLFVLIACGCLANAPAADQGVTFHIQLIRGTQESKPADPAWKPIGEKLSKRLEPVFRWKHYWEVTRQSVAVHAGKVTKVTISPERVVEIELIGAKQRELRLFQNGELRRRMRGALDAKMSILGGDREGGESWFVVVRRDQPP